MDTMRKINILLAILLFLPLIVRAQEFEVRRGDCLPDIEPLTEDVVRNSDAKRRLSVINKQWDPERVYRQLVILVSFAGDNVDFQSEDPQASYNDIFNTLGYNERQGKGCVADYFRTQSGGLFNAQFDVYGPYRVEQKAQPYTNPTSSTRNIGRNALLEATSMFLEENPNLDFSVYDWNGDGQVEQVIFVCAGYAGNSGNSKVYGYLWPNTSSFTTITTPDNHTISNYTASAELWPNDVNCGIGTICHEYTHSLGLPDVYPTSASAGYSVLDEWDLMDGGNFTNYGWCPPNYTPMEKILLGWATPVELTDPLTVRELNPSEEGGDIYRITLGDNDWLLLENRQQRGWDYGVPGQGLLVYHMVYDSQRWAANAVNNNVEKRGYELVYADNRNYDDWYDYYVASGLNTMYMRSPRLNSILLSGAPFPYMTDSTETVNAYKELTHIILDEDGLVSFDYKGGDAILSVHLTDRKQPSTTICYDLSGQLLGTNNNNRHKLTIVRKADGTMRKVLK